MRSPQSTAQAAGKPSSASPEARAFGFLQPRRRLLRAKGLSALSPRKRLAPWLLPAEMSSILTYPGWTAAATRGEKELLKREAMWLVESRFSTSLVHEFRRAFSVLVEEFDWRVFHRRQRAWVPGSSQPLSAIFDRKEKVTSYVICACLALLWTGGPHDVLCRWV